MRKHLLGGLFGLLCGCMCISTNGYSQVTAFVRTNQQQPQHQQKTILLSDLLIELENRYQVRFNYSVDLLKGVQVNAEDIRKYKSIDKSLNQLLEKSTQLRCKKIEKDTYVIVRNKEISSSDQPITNDEALLYLQSATGNVALQENTLTAVALTVAGQVMSENDDPLPGASVSEKGTTNGTTTDAAGKFTLNVSNENAVLVVSFIGYLNDEIAVGNQTQFTIKLLPDLKSLQEVVVVGYQSQERKDIVGAVGIVDAKEMKKIQVASVGEMLAGRSAGVTVTSTGQPGQTSAIKIRGTNSFLAQDSPLYVIDGMFINGAYPDFNPNDVESVQVLKDAAATALYGSRGMNGVIVITTKKGKSGEPRIDYNGYVGWQSVIRKLPLMNAEQYRAANAITYQNAGRTPQKLNTGVDTDWQDELFRTGQITDHNLTFSGGTEKGTYLISGNYFNQQGTIIGPSFTRYQLRVNSEIRKGILKVGENIMLSRNNSVNVIGAPFRDVLRMLPTIPVYDLTKTSGFGFGDDGNSTFGTNPVGAQMRRRSNNISGKVFGSAYAEIRILKSLTYRLNLGLDYSQFQNKYWEKAGSLSQNSPDGVPRLDDNLGEYFNVLAENTLNFNKAFGKHNVTALVGFTTQRDQFTGYLASVQGLNGDFWVQDNGTSAPRTGGSGTVTSLRSWLGSVNYSYDDKYLLQLNVRRDGSSLFPASNRFATFPSISAGWRISRESFMQNMPVISDLKLRASYGTVGNQAIPAYGTVPVINYNINYVLNNQVAQGATTRRIVNPDLRWESKTTTNVGLDIGLLNNKILINADYFIAKTKDLLLEFPLVLSAGNNGPNPYQNLAGIQNRGLELAITYQDKVGDFQYSITGNITSIRNKVLATIPINGNQPLFGWGGALRAAVGDPVYSFYVLRTDGIFQTQEEVQNYVSPATGQPIMPNAKPGDIRFKDINNDGRITFDDRQTAGTPFPTMEFGLNLNASYRGLDLTAFFAGVSGNKILNEGRNLTDRYDDNGNYRTDVTFWTGPGTSNTVPRPVFQDPSLNPAYQSERWLEKGNYMRLKNIQLGYSLPTSLLSKTKVVASLRVYVAGQNLLTFTKYTGYDPEIGGANGNTGSFARGIDTVNYPNNKGVSVGLQAGF